MNGEKMLLQLIGGTLHGLDLNIKCLTDLPYEDGTRLAGFDDGKICGLSQAKGALEACVRLYERYLKDEMPAEMVDRLMHDPKDDYKPSKKELQEVIDMIKKTVMEKRQDLPPNQ